MHEQERRQTLNLGELNTRQQSIVNSWLQDPCWDLKDAAESESEAELFEKLESQYWEDCRAERDKEQKVLAEKLGCNLELLECIQGLKLKISSLEDRLDKIENPSEFRTR